MIFFGNAAFSERIETSSLLEATRRVMVLSESRLPSTLRMEEVSKHSAKIRLDEVGRDLIVMNNWWLSILASLFTSLCGRSDGARIVRYETYVDCSRRVLRDRVVNCSG